MDKTFIIFKLNKEDIKMFTVKKHFHLIVMLCFLTISLSFQYLWAKETLKNKTDKQRAEEKQEKAPGQKQPKISFDSIKYDAGEVYEGDVIIHAFSVQNTGTAQLNIKKVKARRGCAVTDYDKVIAPGQEGKVTLQIDTKNKKGRLNQSAIIFSNDPRKPKTTISISGIIIRQYISVEPSAGLLFKGYTGDKISEKVTISSLEKKPFKITDITSTIEDKIKYTLKTLEKGKVYGLEVKTRSGMTESFHGEMMLKTNSKKIPAFSIIVIGEVVSEVRVTPQFVFLGLIDTSREVIDSNSLNRTVMLSTTRGYGFSIEKIEPSVDWITTDTEIKYNRKVYTISIKLDKDKLPKGNFKEQIKVRTKCNKRSEVADITIKGKVI